MGNVLLKPELIIYNSAQTDVAGVFQEAYARLQAAGCVHPGYLEALLEREQSHPTALELEHFNVAIPHTDPRFVKESCICVVSLANPVRFQNMLDRSDTDVSYVFFLVLGSGNSHIEALSRVVQILQEKEKVEMLKQCGSAEAIYETLSGYLD